MADREALTGALLTELMEQIRTAFPRAVGMKNPEFLVEVYRKGLRGVSGDALRVAVERCIQADSHFPKVARLRELAGEYNRERTVTVRPTTVPGECGVCGARPAMVDHYRNTGQRGDDGRWIMEFAGQREEVLHDPRAHGVKQETEEQRA